MSSPAFEHHGEGTDQGVTTTDSTQNQDSFAESVQAGQQDAADNTSTDTGVGDAPPVNPHWKDIIDALPSGFHGLVTPHLQKWEQGVNQRFQERAAEIKAAREELERFKPYAPFAERNVDPQQLVAAQMLVQELTNDPKAFYARLGEHFGFVTEQGTQQAQDEVFDASQQQANLPPEVAAQIAQMQQQQETIARTLEERQQQERQQQADSALAEELSALTTKYPGMTEIDQRETIQRALFMMQQNPNVTLEEAYRSWDATKRALYAQSNPSLAPSVISTGGASPVAPKVDPAKQSPEEFKADTLAMLKALNSQ
jgi:hypothetical protein